MDDRVITTVMVDDHDVVAAGVRLWCQEAEPPIEFVGWSARLGVAWTGPGAAADVVILDLSLNGPAVVDGTPDIAPLRQLVDKDRRVVVFTQHTRDDIAVACIRLGAMAYVTKAEGRDFLVEAVRRAAQDRATTPPSLGGALAVDDDPSRPKLTDREVAALRAWFGSSSKTKAAKQLNVSPRTVCTYVDRARLRYALVGRPAKTKSSLIARALEDGLITLDELRDMEVQAGARP